MVCYLAYAVITVVCGNAHNPNAVTDLIGVTAAFLHHNDLFSAVQCGYVGQTAGNI